VAQRSEAAKDLKMRRFSPHPSAYMVKDGIYSNVALRV
jgi:hypothetical protein